MAIAFRNGPKDRIFIRLDKSGWNSTEHRLYLHFGSTIWPLSPLGVGDDLWMIGDALYSVERALLRSGQEIVFVAIQRIDDGQMIWREPLNCHPSLFEPLIDYSTPKVLPPFNEVEYEKSAFLAFYTHVYNDEDMLRLWERHYAKLVGHRNLYVIDHGSSRSPAVVLHPETRVISIPRGPTDQVNIAQFCGSFQRFLLTQYRWVSHVDSDELLVHRDGQDALLDVLQRTSGLRIFKPAHAYDIIHNHRTEQALRLDQPVSLQRSALRFNEAYLKPCIANCAMTWTPGFHSVLEDDKVRAEEGLWLMHLAAVDLDRSLVRDVTWKRLPQSISDAANVDQSNRAETLDQIKAKFDQRLAEPAHPFPEWMRGTF